MKTIAVITSSRADYSHLYWPLRDIASHPKLQLRLIAIGPQLSPGFGMTSLDVERDDLTIDTKIECLLDSNTDVGMAKTIGIATLGLADCLGQMRPDLLLVIADRYEMLAPASVALALRIPLVHIEGGEISEGAIDDAVRNALTKLSHIHFTSNETARQRVIAMGEAPWRVHSVGAPSLDHLRRSALLSRNEVEREISLDLSKPTVVVAFHPVTIARDTTQEADAFFGALAQVPEQIVFCYPNADAGSRTLIERIKTFTREHECARLSVSLRPVLYWSLLRDSYMLLGNSSSGIMEAASFGIPAVDVGMRQRGRERGKNVLHAEAEMESISQGIAQARNPKFRAELIGMTNPYGDGRASERIVSVLDSLLLGPDLFFKSTVRSA